MAQRAIEDNEGQCSTEDVVTEHGLTTTPMTPQLGTRRQRTPLPKIQLCE